MDWSLAAEHGLRGGRGKLTCPPGLSEVGGCLLFALSLLPRTKALYSDLSLVMKNFDIRQTARDEEIEALKQAKAILSGAKFEAFLQSA